MFTTRGPEGIKRVGLLKKKAGTEDTLLRVGPAHEFPSYNQHRWSAGGLLPL